MPNPKTGSNRWVPDIRPDKVETATETNEEQSEQYRIVDAHPILGGILDKLAYFRTHAGAVWYNKLAGITVLQKLDNLASNIGVLAQLATTDKTSLVAAINALSSQVDSLNSHFGKFVYLDEIISSRGGQNEFKTSFEIAKTSGMYIAYVRRAITHNSALKPYMILINSQREKIIYQTLGENNLSSISVESNSKMKFIITPENEEWDSFFLFGIYDI